MATYKEQKENQIMFVLLKKDTVLGVFGSFRKSCEYAKELDSSFPSFWTLTRKKKERMDVGEFSIQATKKH